MRMHFFAAIAVAAVSVACVGNGSTSTGMMTPATAPTPTASSTLNGTWTGAASDSTGTMMGAGLLPPMMGNMTWEITQTGNTFAGVMRFAGYSGTGTMSGTISGKTITFTMTMPSGSMMTATCAAAANGTIDMDDLMTLMHGSYSGLNSCSGSFDHGQMTMTHR